MICCLCAEDGADVCVDWIDTGSGPGIERWAHEACAALAGIPPLYAAAAHAYPPRR